MDKIKEQMKEYGVEFIIDKDFKLEHNILKVECDLDVNLGLDWVNNCLLKKVTKRGTNFYCSFHQTEEKLTLSFFTKCPEEYFTTMNLSNKPTYFTTFMDMCWLYSEGTTNENVGEVATAVRSGLNYSAGDLTWALPSKFVDDFVEMVHTINPDFMSGLMQDAIVYGPYREQGFKF